MVVDGAGSGAWNMAVDEVLLDGSAPFDYTLRFYRWIRPTVSLGYAQRWGRGFDPEIARRHGIDLVRRPTGGRAVLHDDELTYSVAAPGRHGPLSGGVLETYRRLAGGLAAGLRELGAEVELVRVSGTDARRDPAAERDPAGRGSRSGMGPGGGACFSVRSRYEVLLGNRKVVGSAQRRREGRVLQHGSLLLGSPEARLWRALGPGGEEAAAAATGLQAALAARPGLRRTTALLARGIGDVLGLSPVWRGLSRSELRTARGLARRYASGEWTYRR